jgi:thiol-disulfide isomerase/thioredoxin
MSTRAMIGMFLALTAGLVIFLFVRMSGDDGGGLEVGPKLAAAACPKGGQCLPDMTWIDTNGTAYSREQLAGKVVIVNFWATWCHPCQQEIPGFAKVSDRYQGKAVIFGVMTDDPDSQTLLNYMSDYEMTYPVVRKTRDIMYAFHYPDKLPTTYVFDGQGNQRTWKLGPMNETELSGVIDKILHN